MSALDMGPAVTQDVDALPPSGDERPCACGCGELLRPVSKRHVFASPECRAEHSYAQRRAARAARRASRPRAKLKLIDELRAEVPAHLCIYCEKKLPPKARMTCNREDCVRDYMRDYGAQRRILAAAARPARVMEERLCALPTCCAPFTPRPLYPHQRYCTPAHQDVAARQRLNKKRRERRRRR